MEASPSPGDFHSLIFSPDVRLKTGLELRMEPLVEDRNQADVLTDGLVVIFRLVLLVLFHEGLYRLDLLVSTQNLALLAHERCPLFP